MNKLIKISIPLLLIPGLVLGAACAGEAPETAMAPLPPETAPPPPGMMKESADESEFYRGGGEPDQAGTERRIVRTGYLTLEVDSVVEAMDKVAGLAKELAGYVVSSNKHEDDGAVYGRVSIRVPVERFDEAFNRLRQLAVNVPYESTEGRDVTEEYTDLEAQLRNLEATEAQYLALLEKAETVEDILAVQRELSNVRREIERIKGRMQYLERTSDMSLIEANLQETKPLGQTGWNALQTLKSAARGLISFGKILADVGIWLVIFCPIWIPILVLVLFFRRRRRKAKA